MATLKTHVALKVTDVERSVAFYQAMFERPPVKHKAGYAKFDIEDPGLNLTLNVSEEAPKRGVLSHLGIQVESTADVRAANERIKAAGIPTVEEFNSNCCYALQDKIWVKDPDGNSWEIFVVHVEDTAPELEVDVTTPTETAAERTCCA